MVLVQITRSQEGRECKARMEIWRSMRLCPDIHGVLALQVTENTIYSDCLSDSIFPLSVLRIVSFVCASVIFTPARREHPVWGRPRLVSLADNTLI